MAFGRKNFGGKKRKRTAPNNIADDFEREKHQKDLAKHLSKLNEDGTPEKLLTKSQLMSIIRGAIREHCWMYAPNKLAFENMSIIPDDSSSRRRWKRQCEDCKGWFKKDGEVQTDHKVGEHSLKDFDQIWEFYTSIANVPFEGMASLCVECHSKKSAMERYGYTEEEVIIFKKVTSWESLHKKATPQKKFLMANGFTAEEVSNPAKRREAIWKYFVSLEEK